jgi:hypothetical protein
MAKISAHDTTPGHTFSTFDFMLSTILKPLTDLLLECALFSPWKEEVSSRSNDPSQHCEEGGEIAIKQVKLSRVFKLT